MTEYTLFLDESYDDNTDLFCIAGCIIKNTDLDTVSNEIERIKELIWTPNEISSLSPILHSTELNIAYKNRNNSQISRFTKGAYTVFNTKTKDEIVSCYQNVYTKLSLLVKKQDITTLCCIIDRKKFLSYYSLPSEPRLIDDWYDIAMQEILEAYTHFLCKVNGIGSIIYEARTDSSNTKSSSLDNKMFHNFCKVKVNGKGVSYLTNRTIYNRIRFFNIVTKKENHAGLQLADFIAFNYIKWYTRNDNDRTEFMKRIHQSAYNGNHILNQEDLRACWGVRILPTDVTENQKNKAELKKLKKSYENLKNERNRLNRKLAKITDEKHDLQKKYDKLVAQLTQLNTSTESPNQK